MFFLYPKSHFDFAMFFASNLPEATTKPNSCISCIELGSYPPILTNYKFFLVIFSFKKFSFFNSLFSIFFKFILCPSKYFIFLQLSICNPSEVPNHSLLSRSYVSSILDPTTHQSRVILYWQIPLFLQKLPKKDKFSLLFSLGSDYDYPS